MLPNSDPPSKKYTVLSNMAHVHGGNLPGLPMASVYDLKTESPPPFLKEFLFLLD